jgi:hypothetical protein
MMADLREELDALARTQTFSPDPSAWDRGRRVRRRSRAAAAVVAMVVVAVVVGAGALSLRPDREARTASTGDVGVGAVPRRIEDITADLEPTTDLAVGRGAAAFISTSQRAPVVVTAADGVAHRLDLPGWSKDGQALALSPDGLRLVWQQTGGDGGATISVVELTTGRQRSHEVHPAGDLSLRELTWSPDSEWLGWLGDADGGAHVGRLRMAGADLGLRKFVRGNIAVLAISSAADVVLGRAGGLYRMTVGQPELITSATGVGAGLFSPDARFVALRSSPSDASSTLRISDGAVLTHPFPDETFDSAAVLPLGWLDERHQLLQVWSAVDEDAELVVTTPQVGPASTWRRSVGSVDASIAGRVSLAVDLIPDLDGTSSQELTHDFGSPTDPPPAPLGIELSLFIGLAVAAAIAVLLGLRWLWRRLLP